MKTRHVVGRRTTMHWEVTGIIINQVWAVGGHLAGGRIEARGIVGDAVCLPALLFDSSSSGDGTSVSGQVGEALC